MHAELKLDRKSTATIRHRQPRRAAASRNAASNSTRLPAEENKMVSDSLKTGKTNV